MTPSAEPTPLAGRTVLVPRAPERAGALAGLLRDLGAEVLVSPVTTTAPPAEAGLDAAVRALDGVAWVAVTSVNGVEALTAAADRAGIALARAATRWAAVGPATAAALRGAGVEVALEAAGTAADLAAAFPPPPGPASPTGPARPPSPASPSGPASPPGPASGRGEPTESEPAEAGPDSAPPVSHEPARQAATPDRRVLLPLGDLARTTLADGLRARGWDVRGVVAYRTVPAALPHDVVAAARARRLDAAVVAAGSAARELARQLGGDAPPVVAIGRPSADAARAAGLRVAAVAAAPTDAALAAAVVTALAAPARPWATAPEEENAL
ncbi:uroporphyrinogen-III synthase [Xylanimonas ulmi]|uniref:Uroporphyrinogen-III synthase n=1 Tax=Xylanimonas ulmi TaxID=228973 RepID=A0A4Q7M8K0_9MICO|nr:uroporphyrinogen-III synthase [Xylanibacterium ulmi]RZS62489.1 uroporphyrinogen-III synthase [Xylanibacterium ulmi]